MISSNAKIFWCHICSKETNVTQKLNKDYECNTCKQTFVEEIENSNSDNPRSFHPQIEQFQQRNAQNQNSQQEGRRSQSATRNGPRIITYRIINNGGNGILEYSVSNSLEPLQALFPGGPLQGEFSDNMMAFFNENPILNMFLNPHHHEHNPYMGFIHNHPSGDNFESLLNWIMMNDPNTYGTPPASKESIQSLRKEIVNEKNKQNFIKIECSVCKDCFELNQKTMSMPCLHSFHEDCLLPWLNLHNSCPICRYELKTDNKEYEDRKHQSRTMLRRVSSSSLNGGNRDPQRRSSSMGRSGVIGQNSQNNLNHSPS
jgi:E3 ubiquitin-protein ligase RNF115/126